MPVARADIDPLVALNHRPTRALHREMPARIHQRKLKTAVIIDIAFRDQACPAQPGFIVDVVMDFGPVKVRADRRVHFAFGRFVRAGRWAKAKKSRAKTQ